jgi:6-phosphogluconolactonase
MPPAFLVCVGSGETAGDIQVFWVTDRPQLELLTTTAAGAGVSYMSVHPGCRVVYVTHSHENMLSSFAVDWPAQRLRPLDCVRADALGASGAGANYATVDRTGRFLLVASFRGSTVTVWTLGPDGRIGDLVQTVTAGRNAHCVRLDPSNTWAFATFLGSDLIAQYRFDEQAGTLTAADRPTVATAPGAGPRHLDFHPTEPWAFLVNELEGSLYRFALDRDRHGLVERLRIPATPEGYDGRRWSADLHVAPSGRFVYVSNRAHDSLARFSLAPDGAVSLDGHDGTLGRTPRSFSFDPSGTLLFVANQDSANVVTFSVDGSTGALRPLDTTNVSSRPYFVTIVPRPDPPAAT